MIQGFTLERQQNLYLYKNCNIDEMEKKIFIKRNKIIKKVGWFYVNK